KNVSCRDAPKDQAAKNPFVKGDERILDRHVRERTAECYTVIVLRLGITDEQALPTVVRYPDLADGYVRSIGLVEHINSLVRGIRNFEITDRGVADITDILHTDRSAIPSTGTALRGARMIEDHAGVVIEGRIVRGPPFICDALFREEAA